MRRLASLTILLFLCGSSLLAANWPNWRGPNSDGSTPETDFPLAWDRTNHVRWRLPLPGPGNSSPIVWGDRVFITQAAGKQRSVWCIDRKNGSVLWKSGPVYELPEETMRENNPYCSASPVTDGERVIAFFGSAGLYCFDFGGRELWHVDSGKISHMFGSASSPCLSGDLCYVYVGPGDAQSMLAVNKENGQIAWRSEALRPTPDEAAKISTNGPPVGSWSTPLVINHQGQKQLIMCFAFRYGGYDPMTGHLLWQQGGLGLQTYVTPQYSDGLLVTMSGTVAKAVRPPFGHEQKPEVVWTQSNRKFRFGSGVATEKHLLYLSENGLAECWEKNTGRVLWQERLKGPGAKNTSWSSLSCAGDHIYVPNQAGDVFVFAGEPAFRLLATNSVAEPGNASLALANGSIIMRTDQALWCFDAKI